MWFPSLPLLPQNFLLQIIDNSVLKWSWKCSYPFFCLAFHIFIKIVPYVCLFLLESRQSNSCLELAWISRCCICRAKRCICPWKREGAWGEIIPLPSWTVSPSEQCCSWQILIFRHTASMFYVLVSMPCVIGKAINLRILANKALSGYFIRRKPGVSVQATFFFIYGEMEKILMFCYKVKVPNVCDRNTEWSNVSDAQIQNLKWGIVISVCPGLAACAIVRN